MRNCIAFVLAVFACMSVFSICAPARAQELDPATENRIKVNLINARRAYETRSYEEALSRLTEIEQAAGDLRRAEWQSLKIKVLVGLELWEQARSELDMLFSLELSDSLLEDIANSSGQISEHFAMIEDSRRVAAAAEAAERDAWSIAVQTDDEAGYKAYLASYPDGKHSETAKKAIVEISLPRLIRESHAIWRELVLSVKLKTDELEGRSETLGQDIFGESVATEDGYWNGYVQRLNRIAEATSLDEDECRRRLKVFNYVKVSRFGKIQAYFCENIVEGRLRIETYSKAYLEPLKAMENQLNQDRSSALESQLQLKALCEDLPNGQTSGLDVKEMCGEIGVLVGIGSRQPPADALPIMTLPAAAQPRPSVHNPAPVINLQSSVTAATIVAAAPSSDSEEPTYDILFGEFGAGSALQVDEPIQPSMLDVPGVTIPTTFCSAKEKDRLHNQVYRPARDIANQNLEMATQYMQKLQQVYNQYDKFGLTNEMNRIAKQSEAYATIARTAYAVSNLYAGDMFNKIMTVPVINCAVD